ncbi:TPA: methionine gamma-lyase, partial [Candidatus Azambacteria bacterium]|nr:methionine gamma-lyase [Candidatus Azambacteria bacterium]
SDRIYGGTFNLFNKTLRGLNVCARFVKNPYQIDDWAREISANTRFLYVETPSNPTLDILDIQKLAGLAKERRLILVVDNTVATPALQTPLKLGADIVIHSLTKYIAGNGTDIGGMIVGKKELIDKIRQEEYRDFGPCLNPEAAWLFLLGLETLTLRMRKHCQNALKVAKFLRKHPKVLKVNYPGLPDHPLHAIGKKQMKGFSGLL